MAADAMRRALEMALERNILNVGEFRRKRIEDYGSRRAV
jgi:hypothetical protein